MDGLSGIKIYNKLEVNTEFLPKAYGKNNNLIVTGVTHKLSNNDWETDIEATLIPKSSNLENITISQKSIQDSIDNVANQNPPPTSSPAEDNKIITLMNILIKQLKFTVTQAAAIAGNVKAESSFKEWNVENGKESKYLGSGIGLMQWTDVLGKRNGRYNFEKFVGKWLTSHQVSTPYVKNNFLNTNPKNYNNGKSLETALKSIPRLFEAQVNYVPVFIEKRKPNVIENFNTTSNGKGILVGNSSRMIKSGSFLYASGGKVQQNLGGYTELFLIDGETPGTVLKALDGKEVGKYHKEVYHRVNLAQYCLQVYNKSK
jgi:hypothetical protein